jgi:hypothetical protein
MSLEAEPTTPLDELFDEYFPIGTVTANDSKDDDKALLATQVLEYRRNKFKTAILAWVNDEIEKAFKLGFYSGQAMAGVELEDCHKNWLKLNQPKGE